MESTEAEYRKKKKSVFILDTVFYALIRALLDMLIIKS